MEFHLYYKCPLKTNGTIQDKHRIREVLHPQLAKLWEQEPLVSLTKGVNHLVKAERIDDPPSVIYVCKDHDFACIVNERLKLYAELNILFLRNELPGNLVSSGGDIDNRLKTLFDGLRRPMSENEIPPNADLNRYDPFHCLLSDDGLITKITVTTAQLLAPEADNEVVLIIAVRVRATQLSWDTFDIAS